MKNKIIKIGDLRPSGCNYTLFELCDLCKKEINCSKCKIRLECGNLFPYYQIQTLEPLFDLEVEIPNKRFIERNG
jgi:hypothetical protein